MRKLLSKSEVARIVGYHPESMMRMVRAGGFPAPIRMGEAANAPARWLESEVEEWLDQRISARDHLAT
jgi:predicted DNA-binding transcriptional regulator AlpA